MPKTPMAPSISKRKMKMIKAKGKSHNNRSSILNTVAISGSLASCRVSKGSNSYVEASRDGLKCILPWFRDQRVAPAKGSVDGATNRPCLFAPICRYRTIVALLGLRTWR